MNSINQLSKRLDKLIGDKSGTHYIIIKVVYTNDNSHRSIIWEMRGDEFIRSLSEEEYNQLQAAEKGGENL